MPNVFDSSAVGSMFGKSSYEHITVHNTQLNVKGDMQLLKELETS